jgi:hypothetical protein
LAAGASVYFYTNQNLNFFAMFERKFAAVSFLGILMGESFQLKKLLVFTQLDFGANDKQLLL